METIDEDRKRIKEGIENLINNSYFEQAKEVIESYEELFPRDEEIFSFKGVIEIMQGNMQEGERILIEGSRLFEDSFDILYNLAYIYQECEKSDLAIEYYKKSLINSKNEREEDIAYNSILNMGVNKSKEEIVSSLISESYYNNAEYFYNIGDKSDAALYYGLAYKFSGKEHIKNEVFKLYDNNKESIRIFETAAYSEKKKIIILSSCAWGEIYQRMHHIARSLAKFEHEIIYVTPSVNLESDNDSINLDDLRKYSIDNVKKIDGVEIISPISLINNKEEINNYTYLVQFLLERHTDSDKVAIITYMPYQIDTINKLRGDFVHIYDCVDDHSDMDYAFWGTKMDSICEQELMDKADAITTTATSLYLQRRSIEERKNVYLSKNAVNEMDFIIDEDEMPEDLNNIPEPRIVYAGVVYKRFDEKLFYEVVDSNVDKSFIIIGPIHDGMLREKRDNLYLLGVKKHSELKCYFNHMQIGIVPYIETEDMDIACDSVKQYEYIACGLPVITTYMPESALDKIYTYLANTKDEFNIHIESCVKLDIDKSKISQFMLKNSWNSRASLLCRIIDGSVTENERDAVLENVGKKLEEIVTKYNNPIFKTLKSVYMNMMNTNKFEILAKEAYKEKSNKFIERQYLISLLLNSKIEEFMKVALNSEYIANEIKEELIYCKYNNEHLKFLVFLCIGDIRKAIIKINEIENEDIKEIYLMYIRFSLSESFDESRIVHLNSINYRSPIFMYLVDKINSDKEKTYNKKLFISNLFNSISKEFIDKFSVRNIKIDGYICDCDNGYDDKIISIKEVVEIQKQYEINVIVPYDIYYIKQVRMLAQLGLSKCKIAINSNNDINYIDIDEILMESIKVKKYDNTITFNKFNAADGNVHALIKYIPEKYKKKYDINIIDGRDVWTIENIIKVPLISKITVSGFATFLYNYPKFTYNIELGHGGVTMKACGALDKKDKNSGGNSKVYEKMDCMCVDSSLNMTLNSAFYAIPENKFEITGLPRYDVFLKGNNKKNLEKLLGIDLINKKVVFNMPTFHKFDQSSRIEGSSELDDCVKIFDFDYEEFNDFLVSNNMICVSKVHHGEEISITAKNKNRRYSNIYFINNTDLEKNNFNLYEVLGGGDILITDYSTVYNDFLFLDKPIIFVSSDIDDYRRERGLALEPYDFWTAGPKVVDQKKLQLEMIKCANGVDEYKEKREYLREVFFKYNDGKSIERVWKLIDEKATLVMDDNFFSN